MTVGQGLVNAGEEIQVLSDPTNSVFRSLPHPAGRICGRLIFVRSCFIFGCRIFKTSLFTLRLYRLELSASKNLARP
ncbi:hypothetical protein M378DRAFT_161277, partial [Amanita muscaria Koide BX008]